MIDTNQLSALISAFRVETEKESISPETVGKLLQDIVDLLAMHRRTRNVNSGDLGRAKKRKRRRWFSRKYYASVMRIKEFYEDNIGCSFTGILSDFARRCNKSHV